jgi:Tfp pilus assembly protein PilF
VPGRPARKPQGGEARGGVKWFYKQRRDMRRIKLKVVSHSGARWRLGLTWALALAVCPGALAQRSGGAETNARVVIIGIEGEVRVQRLGATVRDLAYTNQALLPGDSLHTGLRSRATLRWTDQSIVRLNQLTDVRLEPPPKPRSAGFNLLQGMLYFFHRDRQWENRVRTRTVSAAIRGTEFHVAVDPDGRTVVTVLDGEVDLAADTGQLTLRDGEQGVAAPGEPLRKTAVINAINVIQWVLYYPAVLDPDELPLSEAEQTALSASLVAYRSGDLPAALARYPRGRTPSSPADRAYLAAVLLAAGQVAEADGLLDAALRDAGAGSPTVRLAEALRWQMAAVKQQPRPEPRTPELAGEWLAESYYRQSQADLEGALEAARAAAEKSPDFGYAWARVAELEFSFRHTSRALRALDRSLALSPRNAQALALRGFVLAAQNKTRQAIAQFDQALAVDGALGNAWLGRGLCRIHQGRDEAGREDLLAAAALEPQRALLRSYLGKAYGDAGDRDRAGKELELAKRLDPNDPTAWLYSALLHQENNRINEGVLDLERSQELTGHRRVYRSALLLDEDRAVRSANLAALYRDAGMSDVSVREAALAVNADYANYSGHLFLANSYNALRDPKGINLRYETPAFAEYLLANLLAPVGAGTLSPNLSQQEYSKLFEQDGLGLISDTEYSSNGDWLQNGTQYGTLGRLSYSFDASYRWQQGQRPNNDLEDRTLSFQIKQQLGPRDTVFVQGLQRVATSGDLLQYYDQSSANPAVRVMETIEPIILAGYHREWSPASHTLFLGSWLTGEFEVNNPGQVTFFVSKPGGVPDFVSPIFIDEQYRNELEIFSGEVQQLWRQARGQSILGARYQRGEHQTSNLQVGPPSDFFDFFDPDAPAAQQNFTTDFERLSAYVYQHWRVLDSLTLIGGVAYDYLTYPENFRAAPLSNQEETQDGFSPKAGIIWTPDARTAVRGAYTRSLAGASFDQSFQLEPSQVAGFNQSFRSIIPESVGGANVGAAFETFGVAVERRFGQGTYVGLQADWLESDVRRTLGVFDLVDPNGFVEPSGTRETLDYREKALTFMLNQLLGNHWSVGLRYRLADADLQDRYLEVPDSAVQSGGFTNRQHLESLLHTLDLHATCNLPAGWFFQFQASWYRQDNDGYTTPRPGDDFWQLHAWAGYRFPRRRAEIQLGLLNFTDQDYQLNPLTYYNELPRERTFVARLRFNF